MSYYLRKLGGFALTLILVSLVTFAAFQILPGNPVDVILGVDADPIQVQNMTEELGLDRPLYVRYIDWVTGAMQGDLGISLRYSKPVSQLISDGFKVTGSLAIISLIMVICIGLPLGICMSANNNNFIRKSLSTFSQFALAVPGFCMGIFLINIFTIQLNWFPSLDFTPLSVSFTGWLRSLFLPSLAIALSAIAVLIRYIRVSILNEKNKDYVTTAISKGTSENKVMYKHILRNSLIPVITILGMLVCDILGGSIIMENVFSLPGIGKLISTSIASRDLPLIQGLVMYLAFLVVSANFLVDILYSVIDPRIRLK